MADETRSRDSVRVRVTGRQFRHEGEEYYQGDELTVPEWQLESYSGRIERVEDVDDVEEDDETDAAVGTEDASGDTLTVDESGSSTSEALTTSSTGSDDVASTADVDEEPDTDQEDDVQDDGADEAPDDGPVVDPHPSDLTNADLEERVADVDDVELLQAIRAEEVDGENRKGAKAAIDARLDELEG